MRDFHARVANFIQKANLREDEQKWQKNFEMALEIPRTQSIPGIPDNERHKVIEGYLEVLKEKFPLVSDNHATMRGTASQSVVVSDTSSYAVKADRTRLQSNPSLFRRKSRREPNRRRMRVFWYVDRLV
jgi:hypothetical protein